MRDSIPFRRSWRKLSMIPRALSSKFRRKKVEQGDNLDGDSSSGTNDGGYASANSKPKPDDVQDNKEDGDVNTGSKEGNVRTGVRGEMDVVGADLGVHSDQVTSMKEERDVETSMNEDAGMGVVSDEVLIPEEVPILEEWAVETEGKEEEEVIGDMNGKGSDAQVSSADTEVEQEPREGTDPEGDKESNSNDCGAMGADRDIEEAMICKKDNDEVGTDVKEESDDTCLRADVKVGGGSDSVMDAKEEDGSKTEANEEAKERVLGTHSKAGSDLMEGQKEMGATNGDEAEGDDGAKTPIRKWFLDHCVMTADELATSPKKLIVTMMPHPRTYQLPSRRTEKYSKSAVLLLAPQSQKLQFGYPQFFDAVVKYFAYIKGADLITLNMDDIVDIVQIILCREGKPLAPYIYNDLDICFQTSVTPDNTTHPQFSVLMAAAGRHRILGSWRAGESKEDENGPWSKFSTQARARIRHVERQNGFEREKQLLQYLVKPGALDSGWADIEVDDYIKDAVLQLVGQFTITDRPRRGILARKRIGGALLYGPPGTDKTHLARVIARECEVIMISVSSAKISGNAIIIDEVDSLLETRCSGQKGWERSRINQFLGEMDGLVKQNNSPMVLLATNFPQKLDNAVLRRVPFKIHIGLPHDTAREGMLRLFLRDDPLSNDGALIHEADPHEAHTVGVRMMRQAHFEEAVKRTAPTVTKDTLAHIRRFAAENDPNLSGVKGGLGSRSGCDRA
ncbi:hypothetical protein QBC43DRAFT_294898 [Cladorrhinum sp. PSN259]|nr:hypothetical protein QBC43DRAFT_294898 [Cladorrhinum sp. PSN259]